ncbi:CDP-alcohol phosphatidyltransferase family protein [Notoacmeibacter sp. MSK16QG-6]|uniref:CDP-alcohol phosphatidyltransferase family protein n=1 Tax=Notoacmeibacter sp. MSK16QG-6 TaxID=2957982 RepID=UPI0020A18C74|nr:CDP-alcohol phosphatidyltransferase family protein [Notoacmeibacter sp. MSK16QG-6]MCP1198607.1 CDP-alcohol phosphatidyltransferase family protein [Notoacmeibacter sp. MSK16QG-6]
MIDGWGRRKLSPLIDGLADRAVAAGISANGMTLIAFAIGLIGAAFIATDHSWLAIPLLLLSRLGDGLDGAIAQRTQPSDFGGFLDIVLDFAFYGLVPLSFILLDPVQNGVAGGVLLLAFYVNGGSFLAFAVMAEKRGEQSNARGEKSLFFTTGLAEAGETLIVFVLACLFPSWFPILAALFAGITAYTTLSRILLARRTLR